MRTRRSGAAIGRICRVGAVALAGFFTLAPAFADGRVEGFAGYYFPEESDEADSYGVRAGWDSGHGWGLLGSVESFETSGAGYGEVRGVDTEIRHYELSYVAYPRGESFELFSGLGATDIDIQTDLAGADVSFAGTEISIHAGLAYRAFLGDSVYLRPEIRVRAYEAGDTTIDATASIALGFRWD